MHWPDAQGASACASPRGPAVIDRLAEKLVQGCRILADDGQGDLIWGHVSVRVPARPDHIVMKPAGIGLEEMADDTVISVDLSGERTGGERPRHIEVFIHTEIMRARPEIQAVVHTHPPHAVAFGSLCRPLQPIGHAGAMFCDGLPVFERTSDLMVSPDLGRAVAASLDGHNALARVNPGI